MVHDIVIPRGALNTWCTGSVRLPAKSNDNDGGHTMREDAATMTSSNATVEELTTVRSNEQALLWE